MFCFSTAQIVERIFYSRRKPLRVRACVLVLAFDCLTSLVYFFSCCCTVHFEEKKRLLFSSSSALPPTQVIGRGTQLPRIPRALSPRLFLASVFYAGVPLFLPLRFSGRQGVTIVFMILGELLCSLHSSQFLQTIPTPPFFFFFVSCPTHLSHYLPASLLKLHCHLPTCMF